MPSSEPPTSTSTKPNEPASGATKPMQESRLASAKAASVDQPPAVPSLESLKSRKKQEQAAKNAKAEEKTQKPAPTPVEESPGPAKPSKGPSAKEDKTKAVEVEPIPQAPPRQTKTKQSDTVADKAAKEDAAPVEDAPKKSEKGAKKQAPQPPEKTQEKVPQKQSSVESKKESPAQSPRAAETKEKAVETKKVQEATAAPPKNVPSEEARDRQTEPRKLASFPSKSVNVNGDHQAKPDKKSKQGLAVKQSPKEEQCTFEAKAVTTSAPVSSAKMQQPQVRVLTIDHNQNLDSTLFRLQKGYVLQLRPGPTLFGRRVNVFTNHPEDASTVFERNKYRRLPWKSDSINKGDDTALFVEVTINIAGSFHFYFTYDDREDRRSAAGSGYYLVDPVLTYGADNEVLPLDCVQCQTVMAKCLGPLEEWEDRLRVSKESGYNMIHFTPVQKLGASRSGYSLADQLKLNPEFSTAKKEYKMVDLEQIVLKMKNEWKVLSLTDIVLNHTANESTWLREHPECTYNMSTAPHLRPAYVIDRALYHFSKEVSEDKWDNRGIPKTLNQECHLQAVRNVLFDVLARPKVEEFFMVNVEDQLKLFKAKMASSKGPHGTEGRDKKLRNLRIIQDPSFGRATSAVDVDLALIVFNIEWPGCHDEETRRNQSVVEFRRFLEELNEQKRCQTHDHLRKAVDCTLGTISYDRIQEQGPKIKEVSKKNPLTRPYFTHTGPDSTLEEEEKMSLSEEGRFLMAHNGWVMGHDPLKNFAAPGCDVYLRRELIAWGDSVKLRYGEKPEDCPYLWDHMRRYVEQTATVFHGIRLDNCHSTPIHVAEYLLDCARRVRPDLYVIAELFTNSDKTDNVFVNRLGINSLIREAMSAPNSHEEGRLVYLYGGEPVGAFLLPPVRPLTPSIAHAIFLDLTHDNRSPCEVRTGWDMLPSTALVSMACCASGSNRGYDEIVPHHIHVVKEERKYTSWREEGDLERGQVNFKSGIIKAKKLLNDLHFYLGKNGYNQVFVDQVTEHVVTVTRHNPVTHKSVVLVSYTSFRAPAHIQDSFIRPLKVQGKFEEIIFECNLKAKDKTAEERSLPAAHKKDTEFINGVNDFILDIRTALQPADSALVSQVSPPGADTTEFKYTDAFRPGCVIAFRLSLLPKAQEAVNKIRSILSDFTYKKRISEVTNENRRLLDLLSGLSLSDLNRLLYRCHEEEHDEGRGGGVYDVPKFGPFVYCGFQGLISAFSKIRVSNDLGHPICGNLRDGDWLPDYVSGRLKHEPATEPFGEWLEEIFTYLKSVPRYLIPAYFDAIVTAVYLCLINHAWALMGSFVCDGSDFVKALALGSVQFCGVVKSALLPTLSPNLEPPQPPTSKDLHGQTIQTSVTLAAGLPHFCVGYMRNWGRDTFIALPGNLLITGRYQEARWIILAFAGTMRHGLIPNLLDGGPKARFNCRDAIWFWLFAIQHYVQMVPEGHKILKDKVTRLFPTDDSEAQSAGKVEQPLEDVMQEGLERHFQGIVFRERHAGPKIDSQMTDLGFNNEICVDLNTGFPFGGNFHNCGTWMDKMGSSEKAGNKGVPATPRDGSAVEIVGLCKAAVRFLAQMHDEGKFSYSGVEKKEESGAVIKWEYKFWDSMIAENFEHLFWISERHPKMELRQDLINRRGIYKDCVGASQPWTNYQLRCNFPIAMVAAPELFTPDRAWLALNHVEKFLLGPLGIKTLDPSDWKYRGNYDNANDSNDPSVARGFNYHQGPEWVWPVGFFLRARLAIASRMGPDELAKTKAHIKAILAAHYTHIMSSPWKSLPELTNDKGAFCRDSNPAQSWSTGCILEVLYDMDKIESES